MRRAKLILFLIPVLLILFIPTAFSQSGPGGVGNSTTNRLWLKSDQGVLNTVLNPANDGQNVAQWNDFSGNNNNVVQGTNALRPVYRANIINSLPALQFNNDFLDAPALGIAGTGGFSVITVFRATSYTAGGTSDGSGDYIIDRFPEENNLTSLKFASTNKYFFQKRDNDGGGLGGPISTTNVNTASFQLIDYMRDRGVDYRLYLNGTMENSVGDADGDLTPPIPRIGRHAVNATSGLKGYITEVIFYNYRINNAQINIINSYLAAKYGLTISNDRYSYDAVHKYAVAGIGQVDASNIHNDAMSDNILRVNSPSALDNGDYLLFGHDNGSVAAWTTTEAPNAGTNISRLAREWRFDETDGGSANGVGTIKVIINTSTFPAVPVGYTKYALMVDADGDFSTGAKVYELYSPGSDQYYEISGLDLSDGDFVAVAAVRPTVNFLAAASARSESLSPAMLPVRLNYIPRNLLIVDFATADGTAVAPGDYTAFSDTVAFQPGNSFAHIEINVINDVIPEGDETFTVTLLNPPAGINLGTITVHTYTILDCTVLPTAYNVGASASSYCAGAPGVDITLSDSDIGFSYQLKKDGVNEGAALPGTGSALTWSSMTSGTYTVVATNDVSLCINNMTGSQVITENPLQQITRQIHIAGQLSEVQLQVRLPVIA